MYVRAAEGTDRVAAGEGGARRVWIPVALFGLALVVRAAAAAQTAVLFNDGPLFLRVAGLFYAGEWEAALGHHYHPLYPFLVSLAARATGSLESAGVAVSVVAGALSVLALYAFLRRAFGASVAWMGGVLLALHPYASMFAADVQSEGLYFATFLTAVACLWRAASDRSVPWAAAAGLWVGAAYWVRPEGLGVAAVGAALAALLLFQGHWSVALFCRWSAALVVCTALVAAPYVLHLHAQTGEWMLTQKKSIADLARPPQPWGVPEAGVPDRERWRPPPMRRPAPRQAGLLPARLEIEPRSLGAAADLLIVSASALHPVVVLLLCLGLVRLRGRPDLRGTFLLLIVGLYGVVLYGLALNVGYLHRRHVLGPLLPLLGYAAVGVPVAARAAVRAVRPRADNRRVRAPVRVALAVVAVLTLPKTLAPHREERLATRRAAEWLAARNDLTGPVAAEKYRTAYYAGEAFVRLSRGGDVPALRRVGARFLVVDDDGLASRPGLDASGAAELYRVEAGGRSAAVYDLGVAGP